MWNKQTDSHLQANLSCRVLWEEKKLWWLYSYKIYTKLIALEKQNTLFNVFPLLISRPRVRPRQSPSYHLNCQLLNPCIVEEIEWFGLTFAVTLFYLYAMGCLSGPKSTFILVLWVKLRNLILSLSSLTAFPVLSERESPFYNVWVVFVYKCLCGKSWINFLCTNWQHTNHSQAFFQ